LGVRVHCVALDQLREIVGKAGGDEEHQVQNPVVG
jgi:hypothetical protein